MHERIFKNDKLNKEIRRYVYAICAALIFAVNIKTFVNAAGLFPGGFTGITLLIQKIFISFAGVKLPYSIINFSINFIPVIVGFRKIGVRFTLSSCIVIVLTGLLADIIPAFPITYDILLISIFGGLVNGFAVSLCLMGGASSGGTDFIAIFFSDRFGVDMWNYILGFNAIILIIAGALFGWDIALYSILFQFTSTQVVNLLHRSYKIVTLFIITNKPDEVYVTINQHSHHSATRISGVGCYENEPNFLLYSVVSSSEVKDMVRLIKSVDDKSFVNVVKTEYIDGNFHQNTNY